MVESGINIVTTIVVADKSISVSYDEAKTIVEDRAGKLISGAIETLRSS
jgi:hypothetical protein